LDALIATKRPPAATRDAFVAAGVLFDLDNTLFDRDETVRRWADDLARERLALHDDDARMEATALVLALDAHGYGAKPAMFSALKKRYPVLSQDVDALVDAFYKEMPVYAILDEEARRLLDVLDRTGTPFGIVTNGTRHGMLMIGALGLDRRTHCILVSEIVGCRKPDKAIFGAAVARLGFSPAEVLFVGDNPEADIWGAHRAGLRTAWLQRGRTWPSTLPRHCADVIIASLDEVAGVAGMEAGRDDAHSSGLVDRQQASL